MSRLQPALSLVLEIAVDVGLLLVIEVGLRLTTLPTICRRLRVRLDLVSAMPPTGAAAPLPSWSRVRVRAALLVTARWPAGNTCLRRCLLIGHRLRQLDPVLRIGVRRDDTTGVFVAHAWLDIDSRALDADASSFATLGGVGR